MPRRLVPLVEDQYYHVFNRGIDSRPTFTDKREFRRAQLIAHFYRFSTPPTRYSKFITQAKDIQDKWIADLVSRDEKQVEVICYCFMDNHFHFLLRQLVPNGIVRFMSNFQNSYTRYFNTKHERIGQLFLNQFKAVRISTDEQLVHVSRYIHLNPLTSYLVKEYVDLKEYKWSSFGEYSNLGLIKMCNTNVITGFFSKKNTYEKFLVDQVSYQRELDRIKHLILE